MPLQTAEQCFAALQLCLHAAQLGNHAVMSDAGVGALMAFAGLQGAIYNVRINLPNTHDAAFIAEMNAKLGNMIEEGKKICEAVQGEVEKSLNTPMKRTNAGKE